MRRSSRSGRRRALARAARLPQPSVLDATRATLRLCAIASLSLRRRRRSSVPSLRALPHSYAFSAACGVAARRPENRLNERDEAR
eukprot:6143949-Pleurochrysis_carterae.AAC.1